MNNAFNNLCKVSNFRDLSGTKRTYEIYDKFITYPEDANFMTVETNGVREISLSTCTDDSKERIIIKAREV